MTDEVILEVEDMALPLEDPLELLLAMKNVDSFDVASVEDFRQQACRGCRAIADHTDLERRELCDAVRCGLHDLEAFQVERNWLITALFFLDNPQRGDLRPKKVRELNRRIWAAGALTLRLAVTDQGGFTLSTESRGLLARLHGAVVTYLAREGGDVLWNVSEGDTKAGQAAISLAHQRDRQRMHELLRDRVIDTYRRLGRSQHKTAKDMQLDRKTVRELLREAGEIEG